LDASVIASLVPRLSRLLAIGSVVAACLAAGCAAASGHAPRSGPARAGTAPAWAMPAVAGDPQRLAALLTTAESVLGQDGAPAPAMDRQALLVQLACLRITAHPGWGDAVIRRVAPAQRAAAEADIAASADLTALAPPSATLPRWRIVPAKNLAALRADYRAAEAATGVAWFYLAAINFVETDFGRINGPSSAGAQGPMQFLPSTWKIYGHGDIYRTRNAIFAAARLLADHGAPGDIGSALHAYNPSWRYVDAVRRYAERLRDHPRALPGYYHRRILYHLHRGWVLLPRGYGINPAARPIPLTFVPR
jgi:membrane-bound lytic murein transglycosylase B